MRNSSLPRNSSLALFAVLLVLAATPATADRGDCGQPDTDGAMAVATDARGILLTAVGARTCPRCVCDVDNSGAVVATDALIDLQFVVGDNVTLSCPACDPDAECPGVAQFALLAGVRGPCASNADCGGPFATCDPGIGRCRTVTKLDSGWTGLSHSADLNDIVPSRLFVDCQGPAPCGDCTITGLDPVLGNCRCASDNRIPCFTPEDIDVPSCGGERCECYFGPPTPLSAGNAPTCLLNRLAGPPSGDVNVDAGSGVINIPLAEVVHTGETLDRPCPYCDADPVPADGQRGGVCVGGLNAGESCDAQSANTTFPAPGGARHSLDCFPDPGRNISGAGLSVNLSLSTGPSALPAQVSCGILGFPEVLCPCRTCSGDTQIACSSDAECADAGIGTCSSNGAGQPTRPNQCTNRECTDIGGGNGECTTGPDDFFCDGILRGDGTGFLTCGVNADCTASQLPGGNCTIVTRRKCFNDPIVTSGFAHPVVPVGAGVYCIPPTSSAGINAVAGLPGPGRWINQALLSLSCVNAPGSVYTPGAGGCPKADPPLVP